jgi:hypothetical protein
VHCRIDRRRTASEVRVGPPALIGKASAAALVTACERRLPTSAEIDAMDVAGAERATSQAGVFHMSRIPSVVHFYVDGVKATREAAAALPGNVILSMRMTKTGDSGDTIVTRTGSSR